MINKISGNINSINLTATQNNKKIKSFTDTLKDYIESVNEDQIKAKESIEKFLRGEEKDIHNTMISIQKADVSLQLMLQIRNKVVQAYQEIMRMQI